MIDWGEVLLLLTKLDIDKRTLTLIVWIETTQDQREESIDLTLSKGQSRREVLQKDPLRNEETYLLTRSTPMFEENRDLLWKSVRKFRMRTTWGRMYLKVNDRLFRDSEPSCQCLGCLRRLDIQKHQTRKRSSVQYVQSGDASQKRDEIEIGITPYRPTKIWIHSWLIFLFCIELVGYKYYTQY